MNLLPSGAQLAPNALRARPVRRVTSDPSGSIETRKVGFSKDPRLKMIRPLSPGKVALAARGVSATMVRAAIAAAQDLSLVFIRSPPRPIEVLSLERSSADNKALGDEMATKPGLSIPWGFRRSGSRRGVGWPFLPSVGRRYS